MPPSFIEPFAHAPEVMLAGDAATPSEQLAELARRWDGASLATAFPFRPLGEIAHRSEEYAFTLAVSEALARNPNAPTLLLRRLMPVFPQAIAENAVLPLLLLEDARWLQNLSETEAGALLRQANLPLPVARILLKHYHPTIQQDAALHVSGEPTIPVEWDAFARDLVARHLFGGPFSALARYGVLGFFHLPGLLPDWLWSALARHQQAELRALAYRFCAAHEAPFITDGRIWQEIDNLTKPNWTFSMAELHQDLWPDGVPDAVLWRYAYSEEWVNRYAVASHASASAALLQALTGDASLRVAVRAASRLPEQPAVQAAVLRRLFHELAGHLGIFYRLVTYAGALMTPAWLHHHSRTPFWLERFALARNPHAPLEVLADLCEDGNLLVRTAALATLRTHLVAQLAHISASKGA